VRRFISDMNPTLRGFIVIALIAVTVWVLSLQAALISLFLLVQIAFFIAIAVVLYLLWRDRVREDASMWPRRAQVTFYGAVALVVVALGVFFVERPSGLDALAFLLVLAACGFAGWRVWRDQHTFGGY
jgi:uncharacterized membrane protein